MDVTAHLRHLHMSPRKVRRVAHLMRGLSAVRADADLEARKELAAVPLRKLLWSAIANAKMMTDAKPEQMHIVSCVVNEGPAQRRFRPRSRGTAHPVLRRTSHVSLVLDVPKKGKGAPAKNMESTSTSKVTPSDSDTSEQLKRSSERPTSSHKTSGARVRRRMPKLPSAGRRFFQRKSV